MTGPSMTLADRLQEATEGMTAGPWETGVNATSSVRTLAPDDLVGNPGKWVAYANWSEADAAAIVWLRNHVTEIVAALRDRDRLRTHLEAILTTAEYTRMKAEGDAADYLGLVWLDNADHYSVVRFSRSSQPSPSSEEAPAP